MAASRDYNDAALTKGQSLFADVAFAIVPSNQISDQETRQLENTLTSQGAEHIPLHPSPTETTDVRRYTHLISNTTDFPEYQAALDAIVPVVRPSWVEACTSRGKITNPRPYSPDPCYFFSNITISCADIPEGDKEAIIGGVYAAGGQYSAPLAKAVTHLVALTLENDKCETAVRKGLKCKIVLPHWFDDCLKLGKKIDETPYLLPDPEILSADPGPLKLRENKDLYGASSPNASALPTPANSFPNNKSPQENRHLAVFASKSIMLGFDLDIGSRLEETLSSLITSNGGRHVTNIQDADIYVCHYRDGADYVRASQQGLIIGNLVWLYHLITHNTWTSPTRRLLHYPVPRKGIPGFADLRISLSNYTGEARVYLENLVKSTGAEYTKTMRQDNTHLITAHTMSEKCAAAKEWNINIVNHLWLEESYAKGQIQTLTNPRYTHFPRRTNLGEVVGQTQLNVDAVKKSEGIIPANAVAVSSSLPDGKVQQRRQQPASHHAHAVSPSSHAPSQLQQRKSGSGRPASATASANGTPRPNGAATNNADDAALQTPLAERFRDGKEIDTPSTNGSRGAKARALSKLHDLAPDMALYEKEAKRVGGVVYGGRKVSDPDRIGGEKRKVSGGRSRKRSVEERDEEDDDSRHEVGVEFGEGEDETDDSMEVDNKSVHKSKKAKGAKNAKHDIVHRVMLSGDQRWVDKQRKEADEKAKLREIGIQITQSPADATILCAPKIVRTKKFVCAIASAPTIVSTSFLDCCLKHNKIPLSITDHLLVDRASEELYGFSLAAALRRAKVNDHRLLKGWQIFCTEDVHGGFDTFREVVAVNGGACNLYKGRTGVGVARRLVDADADGGDVIANGGVVGATGEDSILGPDAGGNTLAANRANDDGLTLYLISDPKTREESGLWEKFRQMARKHDMRPRIVKPDWLLFVAMAQYIEWDDKWELG